MKNILLSTVFALLAAFAFSTTVTITNSMYTFTPGTITIHVGDTVKFQIETMHNVVEVSHATWNANGNTPLPGFSLDFGGGTVTGLTVGTHYYVCAAHASSGMKGEIIVTGTTGIDNITPDNVKLSIYPNPTTGIFTVQLQGSENLINNEPSMAIYNLRGERIYSLPIVQGQTQIDISMMPTGTYFVIINNNTKEYAEKVVKQ